MNRTLLILSGALVLAGIAVFYVYADTYIEEETGGTRVLVVTAAVDIPFGEPMRASWLQLQELPQAYVEDRHLRASDLRQLIGVPLAQSVRAGEAILRTDLSTLSDQQRTLSGEIPQGMRAVSIDARPESSHAGMLRPGDRVDVILTVGDHRIPDSGRSVVVAQNLLVLSVGRNVQWRWDDDRNRAQRAYRSQVNLEVGLEEAQRLTLARRRGELRLLLRNANDVSELDEPPEIREPTLRDADRRADWVRRFALVQRPARPSPDEAEASD
ncbi:MAG TPA: Flp pilus assembly protein CpaB [Sandaracinaceae bacterium LLY-WYZ-13_1]|nr:Flp pilus assembly protein CpaB [Sandaracinaceae bacterium LLY-WYZ-13_1]